MQQQIIDIIDCTPPYWKQNNVLNSSKPICDSNPKLKEAYSWIQNYKDGLKNGVWKKYFLNGEVKEERRFRKGKKEGDYVGYYSGGNKNFIFKFQNGEYNGTNKVWTKEGLLIEEANFLKGTDSNFLIPILLSSLNAPSLLYEMLPFIFLNVIFESIDKLFLNANNGSSDSGIYYLALTFAVVFSSLKESIISALTPWVFENMKTSISVTVSYTHLTLPTKA